MRWSKVKKEVESRFADKLSGRVQLYITSYGQGYDVTELFNRGWITVDGKEVVNFSTPDAFYMHRSDFHHTTPIPELKVHTTTYENRSPDKLVEKGEFSKFDLSFCCYVYLDMNMEEALQHESPIIMMLAMLDKRLGKRRLLSLHARDMHPLVAYFYKLRLDAEGIREETTTTRRPA